jgi:hypothetical protein
VSDGRSTKPDPQRHGNPYAARLQPGSGVLDPDGRQLTARQEDPMIAALDLDAVRTEALFVSDVQRSQQLTAELIRAAVSATVSKLGATGCAALVAQEFGEHPDCAPGRMRWARYAVHTAFGVA